MEDNDVIAFLRARLEQDLRAGWTMLLRTLRGSGRACEQTRFRKLHGQVREQMTTGGPQGFQLDQD